MALIPDGPAMTPTQRRKLFRAGPRGYAAFPGSGPEGETCGSCAHHRDKRTASVYHKCALRQHEWTSGIATDIRVRSPACAKWARGDDA